MMAGTGISREFGTTKTPANNAMSGNRNVGSDWPDRADVKRRWAGASYRPAITNGEAKTSLVTPAATSRKERRQFLYVELAVLVGVQSVEFGGHAVHQFLSGDLVAAGHRVFLRRYVFDCGVRLTPVRPDVPGHDVRGSPAVSSSGVGRRPCLELAMTTQGASGVATQLPLHRRRPVGRHGAPLHPQCRIPGRSTLRRKRRRPTRKGRLRTCRSHLSHSQPRSGPGSRRNCQAN